MLETQEPIEEQDAIPTEVLAPAPEVVPDTESAVGEIGYVEIARSIPSLDKMPESMQEYVLQNFANFSQDELDILNSPDIVMSEEMLQERLGLDRARLKIVDEFTAASDRDLVNQEPQIIADKVRSRLSELYPGVEDSPDINELVDTVTQVLQQEELTGNPAAILYQDGGIMGETTFSELESFQTLGQSTEAMRQSQETIDPFDLELNNPFPTVQEATGINIVQSSLDVLKFGAKSSLDGLAFLTESPALLADLAEAIDSIAPDPKEIEKSIWGEEIFGDPDEDPFFGPIRAFRSEAMRDYRDNVRRIFRGNPIATSLKGLIEAPTDFDGDIFGRISEGDISGAGKQTAYMLSGLVGELGGTLGAGVVLKAFKIATPRLSVALGGLAAERRQQELLEEGVPRRQATINAAAYGVVNAVLSEYVVVEKLRHMTRLTARDFGPQTASEFAISAATNLAKTMVFDGAAMATSEGLLETVDYITGISDEFNYERALQRTGNGFILGAVTGGFLGAPSRYMAFRNRNIRAQFHYDTTLAMTDLYNMMADIPNQRMRDAVATLMRDNAQMPSQVFVHPRDLQASLGLTDTQLSAATGTPMEVINGARQANLGVSVPLDVVLQRMSEQPKGLDFRALKNAPDGPTAQESAAYIDAVDSFYRGLFRRNIKVGSLVDQMAARVGLINQPAARSSDSLASSIGNYVKAMWNGSVGRAREQFRQRDVEIIGDQTRKPIVDFTSTEVPDVAVPGETLKTLPKSLMDTADLNQAFPQPVVSDVVQAELTRSALNAEYQQFSEAYRIRTGLEGLSSEVITGIQSDTFSAAKVQMDIYQSILGDQSLAEAADLLLGDGPVSQTTGQPFKIDYESFQNFYGKDAAARMSRGLQKTLFTKKKGGVPIREALTEMGFTPDVFYKLLNDADVKGVVKAGGVDNYALIESERMTKAVMRNLEEYNKMATMDVDPTRAAYEKWLKDGQANEVIDRHLSDTLDGVRARELQTIEGQLKKEFARQKSPLIKGGRFTKEARADVERSVLNLDYKYVQRNAFIRDALSLENFYNTRAAEMVRVGNIPEAYKAKAESIRMREYVRAQYKAIRAIKDTQKVVDRIAKTDLRDLNEQGYDTDVVVGARLVLERAGVTRPSNEVANQLQALAQFDPYKYEKLVYMMDPLIPEVREGISTAEFMNLVGNLSDMVEASKNEPLMYKLGDTPVAEAQQSIFNQLVNRELELGDKLTEGRFKPTYRAEFLKNIKDQANANPEKVQLEAAKLAALDRTKGQFGLRDNPDMVSGIARRAAQGFSIAGDFLYSLNIPELNKVADLMRTSQANMINALNGPNGHVQFLRELNQYVNLESEALAFRGKKPFAGEMFTASELTAIVLNLGNEENAARLARRNFNTDLAGLKEYVKQAIDDGVITQAHFKFAQFLGDRYELKFKDVQREHKKTYGRFVKLANKTFPFSDVVPTEWIKSGWYAPIKTNMSPVSERVLYQKKTELSIQQAQEEFARSGFMETLSDLLSETPVMASYEKARSSIEGERLSLDTSSYINHFIKIERVNHLRDASVVTNQIFLDPKIYTILDSVSPGVMENTIWPAVRAFNDQSIHSGALGDVRMESAYEATSKVTTAVTGMTAKLQIAFNFISPILNVFEGGKVADLIAVQDAGGVAGEGGVTSSTAKRVYRAAAFASTYADLMLHRGKMEAIQSLSPYLQARQQNNVVNARQALDASLRQTAAFRAGIPMSKRASQVNAWLSSVERFADHHTQGVADATAFSMFLDGHMRRGVEFNEAIRLAERDVERVMPGYFASELYGALRSNFARIAFQYTNWSVKRLNYAAARKREIDYQFAESMLKRWGALAPMAFIAIFMPSAMEDSVRGMISGRNDLEGLVDDFMSDPLTASMRLASQMAASPIELIPAVGIGLKKATLQATNGVINALTDSEGQHPGYLYNVYGLNTPFSAQDFVNLPVSQVVDTTKNAVVGLFKYGTEGEYQRAYEFMGQTKYAAATPGDMVADMMALANMAQLPVPAGPGARNSVKFLFNLASDQDNLSDSGLLLDLLRGKGENLTGQPSTRRKKRQRR